MAAIKTCEEYVLRELENTQRENELLKTEKQKLEEQSKEQLEKLEKENAEILKENERLKDFMKKLVKKTTLKKACDNKTDIVYIELYGWYKGEKELIDELKKYINVKEEGNE